MKIKDLEKKKMLELLTVGDEIACRPKINNHRFSMLLLFIPCKFQGVIITPLVELI